MTAVRGLRLAVTGASGFCGTAVARLAASYPAGLIHPEIICLGRRPGPLGEHRPWDAARQTPDLSGVDAIVHCAGAVGDPPPGRAAEALFRAVNVDGTARLLAAAAGRPVVWVSSASVYRPGPLSGPAPGPVLGSVLGSAPGPVLGSVPGPVLGSTPGSVREDHPVDGQRTAYGRSKAAGERLALDAGAVVLRPRAVYGHGDRHLLPRLHRLVHGGRALLPGPDVWMSLTAVENVADACLAALGLGPPPAAGPDPGLRPAPDLGDGPGWPGDGSGWSGGDPGWSGGDPGWSGGDPGWSGGGPGWPGGAYNIADGVPYRRDAVIRAVLGVPVRHVPVAAALAGARVAGLTRFAGRTPTLTRYAVEQLSGGLVLDTAKAGARGWTPRRTLADHLAI